MLMRTLTRLAPPKLVRPPGFIVACRPTLAANVPTGDGWLHELKHDGFRIIAHKDGERVHLWSRNGRDRSGDFVAIADAVRALPASRIVLDGEAVAHCLEGLPHFNRLLSGDGQASACLYAFDLLWLEAQEYTRAKQAAGRLSGPEARYVHPAFESRAPLPRIPPARLRPRPRAGRAPSTAAGVAAHSGESARPTASPRSWHSRRGYGIRAPDRMPDHGR